MKKTSFTKIFAAVFVVAVILNIAALLKRSIETVPHFKFLDGSAALIKVGEEIRSTSNNKYIFYACSFEADFNDIYAKADSELSGLGFNLSDYTNNSFGKREYEWRQPDTDESVIVLENLKLEVFTDAENSGKLKSDSKVRDGWITVIVMKNQKENWLIYKLRQLLRK